MRPINRASILLKARIDRLLVADIVPNNRTKPRLRNSWATWRRPDKRIDEAVRRYCREHGLDSQKDYARAYRAVVSDPEYRSLVQPYGGLRWM